MKIDSMVYARDEENAAPYIPYLGISNILSTILKSTAMALPFRVTSGFSRTAAKCDESILGIVSRITPGSNITKGEKAGRKLSV